MFADAGSLAHDRQVEMSNAAVTCVHTVDRESEKAVGGCAAPLRVAGRKMRADVAIGQRAEDCIGEPMPRHVGIGMAGWGVPGRDANSAKRDVVAGPESMHIQARSRA